MGKSSMWSNDFPAILGPRANYPYFQFYAKISFCPKLARTSKKKYRFFLKIPLIFQKIAKNNFFSTFLVNCFFFFLIFFKIFQNFEFFKIFWIFQNFLKFLKDKTNKNFQILIKIYLYRLSFTYLHSLYIVWFAYIRHRISDFEKKKKFEILNFFDFFSLQKARAQGARAHKMLQTYSYNIKSCSKKIIAYLDKNHKKFSKFQI